MMSLTRCSIDFSAMIDSGSNFCCVSMRRNVKRQAWNRTFFGLVISSRKLMIQRKSAPAAGSHRHSAIDSQHMAGHITGGGTRKKQSSTGDVFRFAKVAQWNLFHNVRSHFFTDSCGHIRFNESWCQSVYRDPARTEFAGHRFREPEQG